MSRLLFLLCLGFARAQVGRRIELPPGWSGSNWGNPWRRECTSWAVALPAWDTCGSAGELAGIEPLFWTSPARPGGVGRNDSHEQHVCVQSRVRHPGLDEWPGSQLELYLGSTSWQD